MATDSELVPPDRNLPVRILLVSAAPSARVLVDASLGEARLEYDIDLVIGLAAGLDRVGDRRWDACLIEQDLPDGDGLALVRAARARGVTIPLILLTGTITEALDEAALREGASDCVEQALAPARLARSIRYAVRDHRAAFAGRQRDEALRQDEKMEAIGRLAGGVAHDINNLLTAILGYTDLVSEQVDSDEQISRDIQEIRRAAERATAYMRQLTLLKPSQAVDSVEVDINETVSALLASLPVCDRTQISVRLGTALSMVRGDAGQLEQALANVAINALDAMPAGGNLTIETIAVTVEEELWRPGAPPVLPGSYVKVSVSDTGSGMDSATRARAYEPFFTTKRKGQGLGLPLAHGLVKQSGGSISLESAPGLGTTVSIYLQVAPDGSGDARRAVPDVASAQATILFIEYNAAVRDFAVRELRRRGYAVIEAGNVEEALARSSESPVRPDLLVIEIAATTITGLTPVARLMAQNPGLRVLYISNTDEALSTANNALIEGASLLKKPFTPAQLAECVRLALDAPAGPR